MLRVKRVLCPVDFSPASYRALDHALLFTKWFQAGLHVLYVQHGTHLPPDRPGGRKPLVSEVSDYLPRLQVRLTKFAEPALRVSRSDLPVELEVVEGDVVEEILDKVLVLPADLVVLGTHGHGGLHRLTLGSVAEKVLRRVTCPVLAVPPSAVEEVPEPLLFRTVVCAVDFSEASRGALRYAVELAREADAHLVVAHVLEGLPTDDAPLPPSDLGWVPDASARLKALEKLRAFVTHDRRDVEVSREDVVLTGKAWRALAAFARQREARLLVVGVHGHVPIGELVFGSTAHHLVREGPCPVLTIRPMGTG
ncbi:universal stress protein [Acidobacteria bacterium ACD]|nr:MAG: universal stress protein [Acidobacteriota bacterium]MCE7957671.1 universal stress protein [Acidobacteria bacterium ACB2]MDL1950514.1 universal stress protein [Acidobacteria bacterium ACD]